MSARWEYLVVAWTLTATAPLYEGASWQLVATYSILRPGGADIETRIYDGAEPSSLGFELLNELGAEGWELVNSVVERSALAPAQGYDTAGAPIATTHTFKRPRAD